MYRAVKRFVEDTDMTGVMKARRRQGFTFVGVILCIAIFSGIMVQERIFAANPGLREKTIDACYENPAMRPFLKDRPPKNQE